MTLSAQQEMKEARYSIDKDDAYFPNLSSYQSVGDCQLSKEIVGPTMTKLELTDRMLKKMDLLLEEMRIEVLKNR
jgi:hypothetical protein